MVPSHEVGTSRGSAGDVRPGVTARLTLFTRPGCHLCDEARIVVEQAAKERALSVDERNIDLDEVDRRDFSDWVPVLFVDGRWHDHYRVDIDRLRAALDDELAR